MFSTLILLTQSINITFDGPVNTERIRHFECFNVVRIVDRATRDNKDGTSDELSAHCNKLHNPRKEICLALVPSQVANITAQLAEKRRPDEICESLGYARHFGGGREITSERCARVVDLVRDNPASAPEEAAAKEPGLKLPKPFGKNGLTRLFGFSPACKSIAPEERIVCHVISRFVARADDLDSKATADEICEKLVTKHLIKIIAGNETVAAPKPVDAVPPPKAPAAAPEAEKER
jgi:hypothetical protein